MSNIDKYPLITPDGNLDLYILISKLFKYYYIIAISTLFSIFLCFLYYQIKQPNVEYALDIQKSEVLQLELDKQSVELLEFYNISSTELFYLFNKALMSDEVINESIMNFTDKNKSLDSNSANFYEELILLKPKNFNTQIIEKNNEVRFTLSVNGSKNIDQYELFLEYYLNNVELLTYKKFTQTIENMIVGNEDRIERLIKNNKFLTDEKIELNEVIVKYELDYFAIEKQNILDELKLNLEIAKKLDIIKPKLDAVETDFLINFRELSQSSDYLTRDMLVKNDFMLGSETLELLIKDLVLTTEPSNQRYKQAKSNLLQLNKNNQVISGLALAKIDLMNAQDIQRKLSNVYLTNNSFMVEYDTNSLEIIFTETSKSIAYILSLLSGLLLGCILVIYIGEHRHRIYINK